jgi:5-methylcytosine-specific restriction endonuclease McrA
LLSRYYPWSGRRLFILSSLFALMNTKKYYSEYRKKNREHLREYRKKWAAKNSDKIRSWNASYKASHQEELKEYYSKYSKDNSDGRKAIWHRRRARLKNAPGSFTKHQWEQMKDIYNWTCPMCLKREPEIHLSIDHKIPLSKGGTNYADNIQPLCFNCNAKKQDKTWFASCALTLG